MPPVAFLRTRRSGIILFVSIAVTAIFLSFYTNSYSMPSFNFAWETPISHFLAPFLGSLTVLVARSVTPQIEILAVAPIRMYRTLLGIGVSIFQLGLIPIGILAVNSTILATPMTKEEAITLFLATVTFQGIGMISGALFTSYRAWLLPAVAFVACVGFGFNADSSARPHHILVDHSTASAIFALLVWGVGVVALASLKVPGPFQKA